MVINYENVFNYIMDHFNVSKEYLDILDNVFNFARNHCNHHLEHEIYIVGCMMTGTLGLTDEEIETILRNNIQEEK